MAGLTLKNIKKVYENGYTAVKDLSLDISDREFIIFVGPSGCGKTTTLRMIAGLEDISGGELFIDGKKMNDTPPKNRDIAMVFQNYALYPHMSVYNNMAFGLRLRKTPKKEIDKKVREAATSLGIYDLLERKPVALSGGQRQRVAMGRAIVREPKVFLMDEPLSNLDAKLRVQMRAEIAKLHNRLQTTFIYVTHDQTEAMTLGERIVVMRDGAVMQTDTPQNLYQKPQNMFVAGFIGSPQMNFMDADVIKAGDSLFLKISGFMLELPISKARALEKGGYTGKRIFAGIRPEAVFELDGSPDGHRAAVEASVEVRELLGAEVYLHVKLGYSEANFTARLSANNLSKPGEKIKLWLDTEQIHLFDKDTENAIV